MKTPYCLTILAGLLTGCATPPAKTYTPKPGIAFEALAIESTEWNRDDARTALQKLLSEIEESLNTSPSPVDSSSTLKRIHRTILSNGYTIGETPEVTFGDALTERVLDCSDLTFIYLETLERFGAHAYPVFARDHIFIVVPTKRRLLYWETTTGRKTTLRHFIKQTRIDAVSVRDRVYLVPYVPEHALTAVYIEMAVKMKRDDRPPEDIERVLRKVLEVHPVSTTGLQFLAAFLCSTDRYTEAKVFIDEAMRLDPTSPGVYDLAALFNAAIGNHAQALEMCKKAIENGTTSLSTLDLYADLSMGSLLEGLSTLSD